ncbi:MAG: hypothetical protein AAF488_19385 [Planctomycetota bacterium]
MIVEKTNIHGAQPIDRRRLDRTREVSLYPRSDVKAPEAICRFPVESKKPIWIERRQHQTRPLHGRVPRESFLRLRRQSRETKAPFGVGRRPTDHAFDLARPNLSDVKLHTTQRDPVRIADDPLEREPFVETNRYG